MPLFSSPSSSSSSSSVPLSNNDELFEREEEGSLGHRRCGLLSSFRKHRYRSRHSTSMYCCSSSSPSSSPPSNRRGMTFLGFCDYRIATVLLNVLHMVLTLILELCEALEWNRNYIEEPPVLTLLVIASSGLGVFGALHFESIPMYMSSFVLMLLWYLYLVERHIFGLVLICFILFVHVVFVLEMNYGIMTKETYADVEEYIDKDGRFAIATVHSLSVDIGETAVEFVGEVANAVERQSSEVIKQTDVSGIGSDRKLQEC